MGAKFACLSTLMLTILLPIHFIATADSVISTGSLSLLPAGDFSDDEDWEISSTTGFTQNPADFTIGMVADGELSFTHSRPDNFAEFTSWATNSETNSNSTTMEPDGFYTWSRGPDISSDGYSFTGMHDLIIENVSLILHFSIPDALTQDEVNVLLQNHGSDKLVTSFANTLQGVNRLENPLVIDLDQYVDWGWDELEETQFTVDYVSDNSGLDDSEVRVDAVGMRVRYHQPWYSFENSKAEHTTIIKNSPILEFDPYDGEIHGLTRSSCGLESDGSGDSYWEFDVIVPPEQTLGRIHSFGSGNHTMLSDNGFPDGALTEIESGDKMNNAHESQRVRVEIEDGCLSSVRIDVNDPELVINGRVSGSISGLSPIGSNIRFAVGETLLHSQQIELGNFSISIPVGHVLPNDGENLDIGIAARFQWSSNGTAENTVVHISKISLTGGYYIEWDRNPECIDFEDLSIDEDEGGLIIAMSPRCSDDITPSDQLEISAKGSDDNILEAEGEGNMLRIQPVKNSFGKSTITVNVSDESGNVWTDSFDVNIQPVPDPPTMVGLPVSIYIELGETVSIRPEVFDPDSDFVEISTSHSWASVTLEGSIEISPVNSGVEILTITASDGNSNISEKIEVVVTANPDLVAESLEVRSGGVAYSTFERGEVVEIVGFVRNQGRSSAFDVPFQCWIDGILVGTGSIDEINPGILKMFVCDTQLIQSNGTLTVSFEIDGMDSITEVEEGNNLILSSISVIEPMGREDSKDYGAIGIIASIFLILLSIVLLNFGPSPVKKEFERRNG